MKKLILLPVFFILAISSYYFIVFLSFTNKSEDYEELEHIEKIIDLNELVIFAKSEIKNKESKEFTYRSYQLDSIISRKSREKIKIKDPLFVKYFVSLSGYNSDEWVLRIYRTRLALEFSCKNETISSKILSLDN